MNILVVGATGTLGRQIVRYAIDSGHQVTCLVRNPRKAAFLKEWGADLVKGDLCDADSLSFALENIEAVIDAATTRATDTNSLKEVDWYGKINLIKAVKAAGIERYVFYSILNADQYPEVPLMRMKHCTELYLRELGLKYTVLRPCGFMQGLIGQYAIPILENQGVWLTGKSSAVAYMNTQDIAKFAVRALEKPETVKQTYPVVGTRAWSPEELVKVCEGLANKDAKIFRVPLALLRGVRGLLKYFGWTLNASDRLAFAEVIASGKDLDAPMDSVYETFDISARDITTVENYFKEYFARIMPKLKAQGYGKDKKKKKRSPFKQNNS